MKKKKIVLFVFLIVGVLSLVLTYNKKIKLSRNKPVKEEKLSIMIKEDGATDYTKSNSKDIPKGDYVLNKEKSYCKNNGKIEGYDNIAGTVSFAFIGTDRCFLYFDYDVAPTISNVSISNYYTLTATFSDDINLAGYAITTTLDKPTSWTSISGETYSLNITKNIGKYYLWIKDSGGNIVRYSEPIKIGEGRDEVIFERGIVTTIDGETINIDDPEFMKQYISVEMTDKQIDSIDGYLIITIFKVNFLNIIKADANFYVSGVREGDTIIAKELVNNVWQTIDSTVLSDNEFNIKLNQEGIIAIYKKTT